MNGKDVTARRKHTSHTAYMNVRRARGGMLGIFIRLKHFLLAGNTFKINDCNFHTFLSRRGLFLESENLVVFSECLENNKREKMVFFCLIFLHHAISRNFTLALLAAILFIRSSIYDGMELCRSSSYSFLSLTLFTLLEC